MWNSCFNTTSKCVQGKIGINFSVSGKNFMLWWDLSSLFGVLYFVGFIKIIYVNAFFIAVQLQLSQVFPLCSPVPAHFPAPSVSPHPVGHYHGSFIHVPCLDPSPSFSCFPSFPSPLVTVSLVSGSILLISLFCSLDPTYRWDHMAFL